MSINVARYGLITNEYRYKELFDTSLATTYLKAREMAVSTNFDISKITNLLADMFGVVGAVRRRFALEVTGTDFIGIDDFSPLTPCFYFTAPEFSVSELPVIITRFALEESENKTSMEIWG